ncbi:hypothetical protein [Humisphaera borealis]|uniref:Periplasmic heavy metal sensor n=1 Tax=Humisphaera borealis TaxID=2807512 RepID=A0A7M2WWH4_9BACT|nr:hypothetical protein [Humisphaera borealis]QOV89191.1 hypothetical protein IPV69_23745 [Humisphaera borealis]
MIKSKLGLAVACALLSMGVTSATFGQEQPQPGQPGQGQPGQPGQRGGRGNFDPAAFREQMNQRTRERLGASEEEWKVLQPRIEKVQTAQRNYSSSGRGGFGGGPGGPPGGPGGRTRGGDAQPAGATTPAESPVAKAAAELRAVTENKEAAAADVKAKLDAYRAAKAKAKEELALAQKELTELLTPKQEAVMVSMGMLD